MQRQIQRQSTDPWGCVKDSSLLRHVFWILFRITIIQVCFTWVRQRLLIWHCSCKKQCISPPMSVYKSFLSEGFVTGTDRDCLQSRALTVTSSDRKSAWLTAWVCFKWDKKGFCVFDTVLEWWEGYKFHRHFFKNFLRVHLAAAYISRHDFLPNINLKIS